MSDISRALFAALLLVAMQPNDGVAQQKASCSTVEAGAFVEADAGISVSYLGDPNAHTCTFYARKVPPPGEPPNAQQKATKIALDLWAKPNEKEILDAFVPALQAVLLETVETGKFEAQLMKATVDTFNAESKSLAECAVGSFYRKVEFQSYGDVVSCGVQGGRYFVVEAKTPDVVSGLFLPLEE